MAAPGEGANDLVDVFTHAGPGSKRGAVVDQDPHGSEGTTSDALKLLTASKLACYKQLW